MNLENAKSAITVALGVVTLAGALGFHLGNKDEEKTAAFGQKELIKMAIYYAEKCHEQTGRPTH